MPRNIDLQTGGMTMLCQNCSKNEATTHITRIINGETAETHLCSDCAASLGFADTFSPFGADFALSELLGSFFSDAKPGSLNSHVLRCEGCGSTFDDIASSGKIGCPECYKLFYDKLLPSIQKLHGKTSHVGKVPQGAGEEVKLAYRLTELKKRLNRAIEEQNFELAAQLRDEIRKIGV